MLHKAKKGWEASKLKARIYEKAKVKGRDILSYVPIQYDEEVIKAVIKKSVISKHREKRQWGKFEHPGFRLDLWRIKGNNAPQSFPKPRGAKKGWGDRQGSEIGRAWCM